MEDSTIVFWLLQPGCNNRVALHYAIIHNYGSHSYQNIIVDGTAVNYGVVTNWHIISYDSWMFL
jgi:hypothetical protein